MSSYFPQTGYYNSYGYMNPMPTIPTMPTQFSQPPSQPQLPSQFQQNYGMNQAAMQPQQPAVLNGKFVDNEDILKVTEIPMGGYGIYPKADFSEIYFKYWTKEGRTDVLKFIPVATEATPSEQDIAIQKILEKIDQLDNKLNSLFMPQPQPVPVMQQQYQTIQPAVQQPQMTQPQSQPVQVAAPMQPQLDAGQDAQKKGVTINEY